MSEQKHILVVDDDTDIRGGLNHLLTRAGYRVTEAADGKAALHSFYEERPDLVILDLGLPIVDGWSVLERIRDFSQVPVLLLTARASEIEKVRGLTAGADDYVTKPFGRSELTARVGVLLRRATAADPKVQERYDDGLIAIDFAQRQVSVNDDKVQLTPLEFRLLTAFVRHPNEVLDHGQITELVWGVTAGVSRDQIKLYVGYLRRKLGFSPETPIETVRGFGYRYTPPAEQE